MESNGLIHISGSGVLFLVALIVSVVLVVALVLWVRSSLLELEKRLAEQIDSADKGLRDRLYMVEGHYEYLQNDYSTKISSLRNALQMTSQAMWQNIAVLTASNPAGLKELHTKAVERARSDITEGILNKDR